MSLRIYSPVSRKHDNAMYQPQMDSVYGPYIL
jgi:hypothetical protein